MYVSLRLGSFLRFLTALVVGAAIIGFMLAQQSGPAREPADVVPPQVVETTANDPLVLPSPQR